MIERGGVQIGIIGAIGDCYDSISSEMTQGISFKTGSALTSLVKAESDKLRNDGADVIIYLIHDGTSYNKINISDYYDETLSKDGYVDVVFGGHTHSYYATYDEYDVPHLQAGGDNSQAMAHVELDVNIANGDVNVNTSRYVSHNECSSYSKSSLIGDLVSQYDELLWIYDSKGKNNSYRESDDIKSLIPKLYYEAAIEKWGSKYNIVLAGGQFNVRSPYDIPAGDVSYALIYRILPFDNALYLCKIKGSNLKSQFINNSKYNNYLKSGFKASDIVNNQYYYIVADSWTAFYYLVNCEVVEIYDETTFARDLLAEYIKQGNWSK